MPRAGSIRARAAAPKGRTTHPTRSGEAGLLGGPQALALARGFTLTPQKFVLGIGLGVALTVDFTQLFCVRQELTDLLIGISCGFAGHTLQRKLCGSGRVEFKIASECFGTDSYRAHLAF